MLLTIITINRNDAAGLEMTMQSVLSQTCQDFEYVVVDGASTDDSVDVIKRLAPGFGDRLKWVSEPDKGVYNAQNKGIRMATGDYLHFLNSRDTLVSPDVVGKMVDTLEKKGYPPILYGNRIMVFPDGHSELDKCREGKEFTFYNFYHGTLPHQSAYIRRTLFDKYGLYDESLRIVSDWKWFATAIGLGGVKPVYVDIDLVFYDKTGISSVNIPLRDQEKRAALASMIPASILADYRKWDAEKLQMKNSFEQQQMKRLKRHPWAHKLVWFLERCLYKWEKWTKPCKK